ncbi:MAG: hypothetical protein HQL31_11675, partial [Planctomycetes bacterium]|nr:hypothetical protein [Planctomycetota bacterium]
MALPAFALDNSECFDCHEDDSMVKTDAKGNDVSLYVNADAFGASIHGKNLCTSCHGEITELPHPDAFSAKPVLCSKCHRVESDIYMKSDHGQSIHNGVSEAASCKDCHGHSHTLLNYRDPKSPVNRTNIPDTCGQCHGKVEEMEKYHLRQSGVVDAYNKSVHGLAHIKGLANAAVCTDCHGSHDLHRGTNLDSKLYWQKIPGTCGKCHENVLATYTRSVHGKAVASGIRDAPVCTDCHGEHTTSGIQQAASKVAAAHIPETCGQCHGSDRIAKRNQLAVGVVDTYMKSFHGLAQQIGGMNVANCASCHGFHDILPSTD